LRSQDSDNAPGASSNVPPRKKRGPLPARLTGQRPGAKPPRTIVKLVKTNEAARSPPAQDAHEHVWPPQRGPPSLLKRHVAFVDLKAAGIVNSHCGLKTLITHCGFPAGRWYGARHLWTVDEVEAWTAAQPETRPPPLPIPDEVRAELERSVERVLATKGELDSKALTTAVMADLKERGFGNNRLYRRGVVRRLIGKVTP
jgi:hypothetical protein